jgi:hypothetical protein
MTTIRACPFCGSDRAPRIVSWEELHHGDDDNSPLPYSDAWAVICDAGRPGGRGGCGASGGFYPTEQQAADKWNMRHSLDAAACR